MKCYFGIALFIIVLLVQAHTLNIQSSQVIEITSKTLCSQNNTKVIEPEIKPENLASFDCEEGDVYCLCKFHPKYRDCVCMAFPRSVVCSSTFCYENKNSYECNPNYCDTEEGKDSPNCFCKNNANHLTCKCKTNPFHKDCFCMKFPLSHLCNERLCRYNPNTLYCRCLINPADPMCGPGYCHENANSPQCECLNKPLSENCRCINEPGSCTRKKIVKI